MIAGIVLAAGFARRMGRQKLLLQLQGKPVVRWAVERLLPRVEDLVVVTGRDEASVREGLAGLAVRFALNPRPHEGQGSSIAVGVAGGMLTEHHALRLAFFGAAVFPTLSFLMACVFIREPRVRREAGHHVAGDDCAATATETSAQPGRRAAGQQCGAESRAHTVALALWQNRRPAIPRTSTRAA